MKTFILAASVAVEFIGPCSVTPVLETTVNQVRSQNVGDVTIEALEKFEIPYQGSEKGLNSAFGTPTGIDAMEVISDTEMRSYGWCFDVDGKIPEVFPDQIPTAKVKKVKWFFGYAHYLNGQWVSQCEPAYKLKPEFLCN